MVPWQEDDDHLIGKINGKMQEADTSQNHKKYITPVSLLFWWCKMVAMCQVSVYTKS